MARRDRRHEGGRGGASRGVAVVTGGSGGVGRAVVRELAARGFDVAIIARGAAGLDGAVGDVQRAGRRAVAIAADVAEWEQVDAAADRVERELGPIDVWVNDAMTTIFAAIVDTRPEEIRRATEVTYLGQVHGTMAALARMRPRDRGSIISVGSALAFRGIPLQAAYCGAKFATRGFMEALRAELLHEGSQVRVSQVHLPAVNTPQFDWCRTRADRLPKPVAPIYRPETAARAIVDCVDGWRRQRIVGSWNWLLVWMNQLMPGVGDHYMAKTGVSGQLEDAPVPPDRRDDLVSPVDDVEDHGAHGRFSARARGVRDPEFVHQLPSTMASAAASVGARVAEIARFRARALTEVVRRG